MSNFSQRWVNLASEKLGARAVSCSDDFFAPMQRMLQDHDPVFVPDKYDDNGKWMDGWESRRKRVPGHDWCVVKLAKPGVIHGLEIDTTHFTGNYAPAASVEACFCEQDIPPESQGWASVISKSGLEGDAHQGFEVAEETVFTHVKLHIYPDGGVARLRVYAEPKVDWSALAEGELVDLVAALNGGVALACNDQHYGDIRNLLTPGRGINMGDGWETRRRRTPGNDWVIIALAHPGIVKKIEIDTAHFKGNYPDRCDVRGALLGAAFPDDLTTASEEWPLLLPESKLQADNEHYFADTVEAIGPISHIRVNIYPDGGLSRIRLLSEVVSHDE